MRIVLPEVGHRGGNTARLAARPQTLDGLRVGLLDGWGRQHEDGTVGKYPLMAAYEERLGRRYSLHDVVWELKPSVSEPVPFEQLDDYLRRVDVVINGEAA